MGIPERHLLDIALYNSRLEAAKYLVSIGAKSSIGQLPLYTDFGILQLALENVNPPKDENQRRILADSLKYLRHGPKKREIKKKMLKTASAAKSFLDYSKGEIGGAVWSETMGDFYRIMGRPPFDSHNDCMTKTYMDKNDMKKTYTKEQLYFMAKGMGLSVKRDMNKDELCTIIVYSK